MSPRTDLPSSPQAERAVLGCVLLTSGAIFPEVAAVLTADDFFLGSNRTIFSRMSDLAANGAPIDIVTITQSLYDHGELEQVGGAAYVSSLTDDFAPASSVPHYSDILRAKHALRRIAYVAQHTSAAALEQSSPAEDIVAESQRLLSDIGTTERGGFLGLNAVFSERFESLDSIAETCRRTVRGIPTGFRRLDVMTGGLHDSELMLLAARPSIGKTALAMNIAVNVAASTRQTVGIFSLEMTRGALLLRMLCSEAAVDSRRLAAGFHSVDERERLGAAAMRLCAMPIWIDDTGDLKPETIMARAKSLKARTGSLRLVVVDYLQLISGSRGKTDSRYQEITYISRLMKHMAKELSCPVLALSQLNRAPEDRTGPPRLSDLRESGQLEQDADTVAFLWKEKALRGAHPMRGANIQEADDGTVDVTVAKQRNGPTGDFKLCFLKRFTRFENLAEEWTGEE